MGKELKATAAERGSAAVPLSSPEQVNPNKRSALVLDDFDDKPRDEPGTDRRSHGRIIAEGLKGDGLNVFTAQENSNPSKISRSLDFSETFKDVESRIKTGRLPLKKGDIITASFGHNDTTASSSKKTEVAPSLLASPLGGDPTIAQTAKALHLPLSENNIRQNSDEIVKRLGLVSKGLDPETGNPAQIDAKTREDARIAFETNQSIQRLKDKGIMVLSAAGNDGPGRISLGFLAAARLSSQDLKGRPDAFSAQDNGTVTGDGIIPIIATGPGRLLDPTPIEEQQEIVRAGRDGPVLKIKGEDHESRIFDRTQLKRAGEDSSKALSDVPTSVQPPQILDQAGATPLAFNDTIPPSFRFSKRRTEFDSKVLNIVDVKSTTSTFAIPEPQQRLISVDAGSSFVVVNHMKGRSERDSPLFESGNSP